MTAVVKRPRRSERIQDKRESGWNAAERVIHDPYLWLEIAKLDYRLFVALGKITRANLYPIDPLAAKVAMLSMLKVKRDGVGYIVRRMDQVGRWFNPFGPVGITQATDYSSVLYNGFGSIDPVYIYRCNTNGRWKVSGSTLEVDQEMMTQLFEEYKQNAFFHFPNSPNKRIDV